MPDVHARPIYLPLDEVVPLEERLRSAEKFLFAAIADLDRYVFWDGSSDDAEGYAPVKWKVRFTGGSRIERKHPGDLILYGDKYNLEPLEIEAITHLVDCDGDEAGSAGSMTVRWTSLRENSATVTFWGDAASTADAVDAALVRVFRKWHPERDPHARVLSRSERHLREMQDRSKNRESKQNEAEEGIADLRDVRISGGVDGAVETDRDPSLEERSAAGTLPEGDSSQNTEKWWHRGRTAAMDDLRKIAVGVVIVVVSAAVILYLGLG